MAKQRSAFAPTALTKESREEICEDCGVKFLRWVGRRKTRCPGCAAKRMTEAGTQTANKAGPIYEQMVRRQLKYWLGEKKRLGLK